MSEEIAVVGSPEFTTGFRLAGVRCFANVEDEDKPEELDDAVTGLLDDEAIGIIVMHQDDLEHLSRDVRRHVETSVEPAIVALGGEAGTGGLREQIKRAIGIDLMEDT
ncbi:MAG: V-type ATP synthase subunit F [Halobacteriales archaeon]